MPTHTASWLQHELCQARYRISAALGEGGMAVVYRARDQLLERDVVIKVPRASALEEPDFAARFQREVRALARLTHAHVLKVMDVGEHEGVPFLVLEYLAGGSLRSRQPLNANGPPRPLPPESLRDWLPGIASALDYIHQQQYVHRDIKPDNVLFDTQGHVYLSDFGIAKVLSGDERHRKQTVLTAANMVLGTAQYMAPELALGEAYDGRVDQYALAVTVYELLSGRVPVDGPTPVAILMKRSQENVIPLRDVAPGIPAALSQAVERGLARRPQERFADCGSFAQAVLAGLGETGPPIIAPKPSTGIPVAAAAPKQPAKLQCPTCRAAVPVPPDESVARLTCHSCAEVLRVPGRELPAARETPRAAARLATKSQARFAPKPTVRGPRFPELARSSWKWYAGLGAGGLLVVMVAMTWGLSGRTPQTPRLPSNTGTTAKLPEPAPAPNNTSAQPPEPVPPPPPSLKPTLELPKPSATPPPPHLPSSPDTKTNVPEAKSRSPAPETTGETTITLPQEIINSIGMKLRLIPAGSFVMGSPKDEKDRSGNEDEHPVEISKPFYLGIHEVTQEQYERVIGTNPAYFTAAKGGGPNHPVEQVSWEDAVTFCQRLSDLPAEKRAGRAYRLPTEAEWEYACRGGARSKTVFHFGNSLSSTQANFNGNNPYPDGSAKGVYRGKTTPVGTFQPNGFGLYDMHGNVWEWCADCYDEMYYGSSPRMDPQGPSGIYARVFRGGAWRNLGRSCRTALRGAGSTRTGERELGFRLALGPATK